MSTMAKELAGRVGSCLEGLGHECAVGVGQVTVEVPATAYHEAARRLRDSEDLGFRQLVDLCGVDYLTFGQADWKTSEDATNTGFSRGVERGTHVDEEATARAPSGGRFAVVAHLLSHSANRRLRLRTFAEGEPPRVESVTDLWPSANWFEREAFDLFGILFEGHPDLRRILTDYGFIGHPFRKDFPLSGEVEMRYDEDRRRVVYEPVTIEPRTLVPRVIRHDARYDDENPDPTPDPDADPDGDPDGDPDADPAKDAAADA